jgi:hypothetical protein
MLKNTNGADFIRAIDHYLFAVDPFILPKRLHWLTDH